MLHPGRYPEGPGRVSGRKTGRFSTGCETLHPGRYPEGFPEWEPEGFPQDAKHCGFCSIFNVFSNRIDDSNLYATSPSINRLIVKLSPTYIKSCQTIPNLYQILPNYPQTISNITPKTISNITNIYQVRFDFVATLRKAQRPYLDSGVALILA